MLRRYRLTSLSIERDTCTSLVVRGPFSFCLLGSYLQDFLMLLTDSSSSCFSSRFRCFMVQRLYDKIAADTTQPAENHP